MCKICETNPVYEFTNQRKLCGLCFMKWFNKKVLYTIRKFEMIKNGDVVGYENKGDFKDAVLEQVLKMFGEKGNVNLVKNGNKVDKIAVSDTADTIAYEITDLLINQDIKKNINEMLPVNKSIIRPLYLFLDKEVLLYAKIKKLRFSKVKEKSNKISKFVDELESRHPEIKQAVVKGYLKVYDKV